MPWKGCRWLFTAYTCQCLGALSQTDRALLRGWGFPLPAVPADVTPCKPPQSAQKSSLSDIALPGLRLFVDVCCGATRPLCKAFESQGLPVLALDLLQDVPLDIMRDEVFDSLLRLYFSGQVSLMHARDTASGREAPWRGLHLKTTRISVLTSFPLPHKGNLTYFSYHTHTYMYFCIFPTMH